MKGPIVLMFVIFFCSDSIAQQTSKLFCNGTLPVYDTITKNGNFVKYHSEGDSFLIEYGNNNFRKSLSQLYDCNSADAWVPQFKWETQDYIGLKYGCGNPCWGIIILPLNPKENVKEMMYDLAYDLPNNLIVYLGGEDYNKLVMENIKNGDRRLINLPDTCDASFPGSCIDSISISHKELYYRYATPNRFDANKKVKEFRIKF